MQIHPSNWDLLLYQPHITQYRFTINGSVMSPDVIQGVPTIEKPMMLEPVIGRCCTGSLTIDVRQGDVDRIPKAASVNVDCRLSSYDKTITSDWIPQGRYFVTKRSGYGDLVTLTCRDSMIYAGKTYLDKAGIHTWPATMAAVLADIARVMNVSIDDRTDIQTGTEYMVNTPEDDTLMSEVLAQIAAVHGGNFIVTESGKLRLVPFPFTSDPVYDLKQEYKTYTPYSSGDNTVSRIILKNAEGQQFTVGNDTGVWITGECDTATQAMTNRLSGGAYSFVNGTMYFPSGAFVAGTAVITDEALDFDTTGTAKTAVAGLLGRTYTPYRLDGAYIDPCIELGDTFTALYKGKLVQLIANTITVNCTTGYTCRIENGIMYDDEEEVVYTTPKEREQERTAARAVRNTSRIAREEQRAKDEEDGIKVILEAYDDRIEASVTKTELNTTLTNYLEIDDLKSEMGSVFTNGDTTLAASIATTINLLANQSEVHISADVINLDGYVEADTLFSGQAQAGSLAVTGTITAGGILGGYLHGAEIHVPTGDETYDTYTGRAVKVGGTTISGVTVLATADVDIPALGAGVTNAEIVNGHTLKLTKSDTSVINFSKATALYKGPVSADGETKQAGWSGGTFTVIATQTNIVTATGLSQTNEVARTTTRLTGIEQSGSITKSIVSKKVNFPYIINYADDSDNEYDTGFRGSNSTIATVSVDASLIYDDGWDAAAHVVSVPTQHGTGAGVTVSTPYSRTIGQSVSRGTDTRTYSLLNSGNNKVILNWNEGNNGEGVTVAELEHGKYTAGRESVNVTVSQNGDITYTPPTGAQGTHSVQNCGTYNVPVKALGDNGDSDSTTISFDPEAAWSDGYTTGVSSGSSSGYTDGQNNTLVVKGLWNNGSITFSTNAPNPISGSSKTLQILSGSQAGSLNSAGTAIDFAVLEHVGPDNEVRTGATISAAINNKSLTVNGTHSANGVYTLSGTGNVRVGGVNIGLTGSGTLTATEAINYGKSQVSLVKPSTWNSNGTHANTYTIKTSGRTNANGVTDEDVDYLVPTAAFTHGFNICYNSIALSETTQELDPGSHIDIYPMAKGTWDAAQAINITSKKITITAKNATQITPKVSKGTWSNGSIQFTASSASSDPTSQSLTINLTCPTPSAAQLQSSCVVTANDASTATPVSTGATRTLYLKVENDYCYITLTNVGHTVGTNVAARTPNTAYQAGQQSVTVKSVTRAENCSFDIDAQEATDDVTFVLWDGTNDISTVTKQDVDFSDAYRAGLNGGQAVTSQNFEIELADRNGVWINDVDWLINVSDIYQQGVHDRTPVETHTYTYSSTGGLIDIYVFMVIISPATGAIIKSTKVAFYPNTQVEVKGSYTYNNVTYTSVTYNGSVYYLLPGNLIESANTKPSPSNYGSMTGIKNLNVSVTGITLTSLVHTDYSGNIDVYLDPDNDSAHNVVSVHKSQADYGALVTNADVEDYLDRLPDANNYYGSHSASVWSRNLAHKAVFRIDYSDGSDETKIVSFDSYAYTAAATMYDYDILSLYNERNADVTVYFYDQNGNSVQEICRSGYENQTNTGENVNDYISGSVTYEYRSSLPASMDVKFRVRAYFTDGTSRIVVVHKTATRRAAPATITGYSIYGIAHLSIGANKRINITAKAKNASSGTTKSSTPMSMSDFQNYGSNVNATNVSEGSVAMYLDKINGYWAWHNAEVLSRQVSAAVVVRVSYSDGSSKYYRVPVTSEPIDN